VLDESIALDQSSDDFRFAAAVAEFGLLLRDSPFKADGTYAQVLELAKGSQGQDDAGYRAEFIRLVETVDLME
jgi:Ca-activated chloride channel family protein